MCVKAIPISVGYSETLERFDRARDFFGDTRQRHADRVVLEQGIWSEYYRDGRMALILDCDFPVIGICQSDSARLVHGVSTSANCSSCIVLKADIHNCHKLQSWDEKLMLVTDVHLVQGPKGVIPSRVGFYHIHNEAPKFGSHLLLFQGTVEPMVYKSFASIADWECIPAGWSAAVIQDNLVEHEIEGAPQIVHSVSSRQGDFVSGKQIFPNFDTEEVLAALRIIVDSRCVTVRVSPESQPHLVNIRDVLVGPLNLFV